MRRILTTCTVLVLAAACGGSEKKAGSQCPAPQAPVGTLAGTGTLGGGGTFSPAEMGALIVNPTSCMVGTTRLYVAGILMGFPSFQGICAQLESHGFCFDKANATIASVQILHAGLVSAQAVPGPGTYDITVGTPVPDLGGNFTLAGGSYSRTGPTCNILASSDADAGSIVIDTVSSTQVTGSVDVTFADGSALAGTFTAASAPLSVDICQLINDTCSAPVCVP